jgi:hypothetical protein
MECRVVGKSHLMDRSSFTTGRGGKPRKVQRPAVTEIAFKDRYLVPTFLSG